MPVQTIAVYKEERVKIYGITQKVDLALCLLRFPIQRMDIWGERISDAENFIKRFELVTCHITDENRMEAHLLLAQESTALLKKWLDKWQKDLQELEVIIRQPVEALYLFGPHFQDRYGIVNPAFEALFKKGVKVLVSGCAGTSMYFVTPENQSGNGLKALRETFLIPTSI